MTGHSASATGVPQIAQQPTGQSAAACFYGSSHTSCTMLVSAMINMEARHNWQEGKAWQLIKLASQGLDRLQ